MQDEVDDLVSERIVTESVGRISLNEKTAGGMNAASPRLQFSKSLKFAPILRSLENVDVGLDVARRLRALQFFCNHPIMKFGLNRNWRGDVTMNEMINEMLGLGVFPLFGLNRESFFGEWIRVALT